MWLTGRENPITYTERDGIFFPLFNLSNLFQLVAQIHLDVRSDNFLPN